MAIRIAVSPADRATFGHPLVNETKVSGMLRAFGISGGVRKHLFRLEIDGNYILTNSVPNNLDKHTVDSTFHGGHQSHNSMGANLEFNTGLNIQIKDDPIRCSTPRFWAVYEKNIPEQDDQPPEAASDDAELEFQDGFVVEKNEYETDQGINEERILQGRTINSQIGFQETWEGIEKDVYSVDETISASLQLTNWRGEKLDNWPMNEEPHPDWLDIVHEADETIEILLRPVGHNYPKVVTELDWRDSRDIEFSVETPGHYELVTNFPKFGNVPSTLSVFPD